MKKFIAIITFITVMLSSSIVAFSNSGPVYWKEYPSSDIMSIDPDSKISVKGEKLVFDFSTSNDAYYTISGEVTAAYEMVNTTSEHKSVKMAFPFVGSFGSISNDDIVITANDSPIPYDIYMGDVVNSHGNPFQMEKKADFDFSSIVGSITNEPYTGKNFSENERGKLYTIEVIPSTDQGINFAVDFNFNHEKTKVLTYGFNRYERDDEKTRIAAWCYKPEVLEIFVLGENVDLNINGYTDGELKKKTDMFTYKISAQEQNFRAYLMEYVRKHSNVKNSGVILNTQVYNLYAKALDEYFTANMGFCSENELISQESYERIITLVYTVDFPPGSEREVSVRYRASGTMDKTKTTKPLYTFDYILNPAENWKDFKNLIIEIIPPKEAPYIVDSNIDFERSQDNIYKAVLEKLPEEDLSFTLYKNEKITLQDKVEGKLKRNFGYFTPVVKGIVALFLIAGVIIVVAAQKKKSL